MVVVGEFVVGEERAKAARDIGQVVRLGVGNAVLAFDVSDSLAYAGGALDAEVDVFAFALVDGEVVRDGVLLFGGECVRCAVRLFGGERVRCGVDRPGERGECEGHSGEDGEAHLGRLVLGLLILLGALELLRKVVLTRSCV